MRKVLYLLFILIVPSLFVTSCEKKTVRPRETDWDAVKAIISERPEIFRLGFYDTQTDTFFYREITGSKADIEDNPWIHEPDSIRDVYYIPLLIWRDSLTGKFHYRLNGKSYEKPISSIARTNANFEKWGEDYHTHRGWLLQRFSGTVIDSKGTTRNPSILYVVSDGVNDTITELILLSLVRKDSTLRFDKGKQVTFTIDPKDTSDFFFLHIKEGGAYQKIPFTSNGDGTFSAGWTTLPNPDPAIKYYHAIVDVVNRESVTDTTAKYDSKAWGIIYRIK